MTAFSLKSLHLLLVAPLLPLLRPTSSTFNLKALNLHPLLSILGTTLLLAFIGPTLVLQPVQLHPPTLLLPTSQFLFKSYRR